MTEQQLKLSNRELFGVAALLLFCFISFQHADLFHTASCAVSYLRGHWSDFYEWNQSLHGTPNYLPSTYFIYAAWAAPLELLGLISEQPIFNQPGWGKFFLTLYFKSVGSVFFGLSAWMALKIYRLKDAESSGTAPLASDAVSSRDIIAGFVSHPVALYSVLCFGQYDILTVFFVLCGFYFYLQGKIRLFSVFFGVAMTFKYFPAFLFFPWLILHEKRISRWLLPCVLFLLPTAVLMAPYWNSPAFREGVLGFGLGKTLSAQFDNGRTKFSILFFGWTFLCMYAYLLKAQAGRLWLYRWSLFLGVASLSWIFVWIHWHPQWLLHVAALTSLAALGVQHRRLIWILDFAWMAVFVVLVARLFQFNADTVIASHGIWNQLFPKSELKDINGFFFIKNFPVEIAIALFNGILLSIAALLHPSIEARWQTLGWTSMDEFMDSDRKAFWLRLAGGLTVFVSLALARFAASLPA